MKDLISQINKALCESPMATYKDEKLQLIKTVLNLKFNSNNLGCVCPVHLAPKLNELIGDVVKVTDTKYLDNNVVFFEFEP